MKALICLLIFFPLMAWSQVRIDFSSSKQEIQQGSLTPATLTISPDFLTQVDLQKLKGATFAKSLYFYQTGPWLRKDGEKNYQSQVQVIFTTVPESNLLTEVINGQQLEISLNDLKILPTEEVPKLIFGTFEIPSRPKIIFWSFLILGTLLTISISAWGYRKYKIKKDRRGILQQLQKDLTTAQDYEAVVEIWRKKHRYTDAFPHISDPFTQFEGVLFKYQFKPSQTASEKDEVMAAYQRFVSVCQGGFNGI